MSDNLPPLPEMNEVEAKSELRRAWHDLDAVERRWRAAMRERDALARRMDAVRAWAESMPDAYPESLLAADEEHGARIYASGMCNAAAMVLKIIGDGEAGE